MVTESKNHIVVVLTIFLCLLPGVRCQSLYSASVSWIPTNNARQLQFYYHFTWTRQNITCPTPVCLQAYTTSHITVQILNRWVGGYTWSCTAGCVANDVISDLTNLLFAEIAGFSDDKWESGEETILHTFGVMDNFNIKVRFNTPNTTTSTGLGDAMVCLATRNDTNRMNASPTVVLMPIYRVPLGCSIQIDLLPFDGDGDDVRCRWSDVSGNITSAKLDETLCTLTILTTRTNGYVEDQYYSASLYVEDYSETNVLLTHRMTLVSKGPFSRSPVLLTVHVTKAPANTNVCNQMPKFSQQTTNTSNGALPVKVPFTRDIVFSSNAVNSSIMTVGPQGMLFQNMTGRTVGSGKYSNWTVTNTTNAGVVRACGIVFSVDSVPGEVRCLTYMINAVDKCSMVTCKGTCLNYWNRHVCQPPYTNISSTTIIYTSTPALDTNPTTSTSNTGLVVGLSVGLFTMAVVFVVGVTVYLRRIWLRTHRVQTSDSSKSMDHSS